MTHPSFALMLTKLRTHLTINVLQCLFRRRSTGKNMFFGILNLNVMKATQIMNTLNLFFESKQIILEMVQFSVFDGTNAI